MRPLGHHTTQAVFVDIRADEPFGQGRRGGDRGGDFRRAGAPSLGATRQHIASGLIDSAYMAGLGRP